MQMVINLAPVSLSNKKVLRLPKSDVSEDKCHGKCLKKHSIAFRFENFIWGGGGGACPQNSLAARAFGARDLPRLALKSGYGPGQNNSIEV